MGDIVVNIIAFLISAPIIATILLYFIVSKIMKHQQKAFHIAVNWTTILYIIASFIIIHIVFDQYFISIFLVALLLLLTAIVVIQWRTKTEINFKKVFKIFWRFCFIIFFVLYVILVCIGIIDRLFNN